MHAFMVFATNHGTDHHILTRFGRSCKKKLLHSELEKQIPPLNPCSILRAQQGKAMNRTVSIPRFTSVRSHPQQNLFTRLDSNFRRALASDLVPAVAVGGELNHPSLCTGAR